jgi:hypothetical protein
MQRALDMRSAHEILLYSLKGRNHWKFSLKDNITTDVKKTGLDVVGCTRLDQDTDRRRRLIKAVKNFGVP